MILHKEVSATFWKSSGSQVRSVSGLRIRTPDPNDILLRGDMRSLTAVVVFATTQLIVSFISVNGENLSVSTCLTVPALRR